MKTVLIAGKLDETSKELYDALAAFCHPQLCPGGGQAVQEMMRLLKPDVVVVPLPDVDSDPGDVFFLLEKEAHRPPVVAVGSVEVQGRLIRERWLPNKRIVFLQRPIKTEDIAACVKDSLGAAGEEGPKEDGRKKILVVDDDPSVLRLMDRMLSPRWKVTVATSGLRALTLIARAKPDLILLDYDMPVMDGRLMFKILRHEGATKDIPVVFLTGLSDPACVEEVLALHPQGYLLKPPSEEKILSKLESILGKD